MNLRCAVLQVSSLVVGLLVSRPTRALEGPWRAGVSVGYALLYPQHGVGLGLNAGYGWTDWIDLIGTLDLTYHPATQGLVSSATVGLQVFYDTFRVVPYAGVLVGVADEAYLSQLGGHWAGLDVGVPFGFDDRLSRNLAIGVAGRWDLLLFAKDTTASRFQGSVRVTYTWDP